MKTEKWSDSSNIRIIGVKSLGVLDRCDFLFIYLLNIDENNYKHSKYNILQIQLIIKYVLSYKRAFWAND